ncbi:Peptidoglycan-binding (PGRP) domain of peptidoglycan hydrolases-containing protein [Sinosporangium album]|uniref:Peptidoglycan-binding (PGRP) domain of peptidoglycan hydrolases-containing protein n=1 Tax=Sinosporangium album TaxID=504805 RepID=A0A1G8JAE1_9ACTN|nr:peptidoglycan-binding protein [Sinosporangium album]SDI28238.1 Peptidoglycan-binding (PGRP) domain of peptidoglycan hydrolases-containing protein [Sinosporangium album]
MAPPFKPPPLKYPPPTQTPAVSQWQQQLRARGWHITVDGDYQSESKRLCANFQMEHRLDEDGVVGPDTWEATWEAPSTKPQPAPDHTLQKGDTNNQYVRKWQRQVNNRGWPDLEVDGDFGPQTEKICKELQQFKGLPVTGKIDRHTWDEAWLEKVPVGAAM